MIVCTYWTNERYRREAVECLASARRFGFNTYGMRMESRGEFFSNTKFKPKVLLEAIEAVGEVDSLCWLDADCRMRAYPIDFFGDWDIACRTDGVGVWGTVVWINNTEPGRRLLREWSEYQDGDRDDEASLVRALYGEGNRGRYRIQPLPIEYVWTEEVHRHKHPGGKPVIEHGGIHMMRGFTRHVPHPPEGGSGQTPSASDP